MTKLNMNFSRPMTLAVAVFALVCGGVAPASATDVCGSYISISGTRALANDVSGGGYNCFNLSGSGTFDLAGHKISGTGGAVAIHCNNPGIVIKDSSTPTSGGIEGAWVKGIEDCETIQHVRIGADSSGNVPSYGITNYALIPLDSLKDSVIGDGTNIGFSGDLKRRTSVIENNVFQNLTTGIEVFAMSDTSGSGKAVVDHNSVDGGSYTQISIQTSLVNLHDNLLFNRDSSYYPSSTCLNLTSGVTVSHMLCDCGSGCEGSTAPFASPLL